MKPEKVLGVLQAKQAYNEIINEETIGQEERAMIGQCFRSLYHHYLMRGRKIKTLNKRITRLKQWQESVLSQSEAVSEKEASK